MSEPPARPDGELDPAPTLPAPGGTRVIESHYSGLDSWSSPFNYRLLRAGHIVTGPEYRIERERAPGHEFIYCLSGVGHVRVAGVTHRVEAGQLAWIPVQAPHAHYADAASPWEILWLRLDGANLNRLQTALGVEAEPVFAFAEPDAVADLMAGAVRQLSAHSMMAAAATERITASLVEKLMESRSSHLFEPVETQHRGLARLMREMRSHYSEVWTVDRFAEACRVSKSHLFRLFRFVYGQTPHNWLRGYRLSQAKRLLVETDEPIAAIARAVGYDDPLHFSRDFSRNVGMAPSRFRASER